MRKRLLISALLLLLLAPIVLVVVLLYTETGVELLAQQLPRLERIGVRIEGVSGTLSGPLRVTRFELNHPRVHVVVHDIVIEPQLRALFVQTIQTRSVTARDALVEIREADMPPSDRPPRFLPRFLRIDARGLDLSGVRYVHLNGTTVEAERVRGHVTITARRLRVRSFQVDAHDFDAAGALGLLADTPLGIQASAAGHLRLPRAELALGAELDGTLDRLAIKATLQRPSEASVDALFTRPEDRWRLEGTVNSAAFALDPFMDKPPLSLRNVALDVVANAEEIHAIGNVAIPQLSENDLTVDARGRFAERVLHLASVDVALNDTPARAHVAGTIAFTGETPTLDLAARWRSLQWPLTQEARRRQCERRRDIARRVALRIHGQRRNCRTQDSGGAGRGERYVAQGATHDRELSDQRPRWRVERRCVAAVHSTAGVDACGERDKHQSACAAR